MHKRPADILGLTPQRSAVEQPDGTWLVTVKPPVHMRAPARTVTLSPSQYTRYLAWQAGTGLLQRMLPDLSADQREILLHGIVL